MASSQNKNRSDGKILIQADISGEILLCPEGLSFWGGVDPETGTIIDIHHPCYKQNISGKILMMPSSRGSCSGRGVLLELCLKDIKKLISIISPMLVPIKCISFVYLLACSLK